MRQSSERLPWLEDEAAPARRPAAAAGAPGAATAATPPTAPPARAMWPWYLLLLLLVGLVGVGAYWLGTAQRRDSTPALSSEDIIPIVPETAEPAPSPDAAPLNEAAAAPESAAPAPTAAPPAIRAERPARGVPARSAAPENPASDEGFAPVGRSAFPADEAMTAPPPPTGPAPVVVNRNPNRGRVVQLGAFPTRAQAEDSWRRVTRRYPYLATKPKMVNTVDVRGLGGGRPTRMYRLQLGTSSQAQSAVICQQLERAGQSCVVVY